MGEIFKYERSQVPLAFTGERFTTAVKGQIEVEHLHRYMQARGLCRNRDVLDVASGEGYGSALLAQVARRVVGVEIDPLVVAHANLAYNRDNLSYIVGDARRIPLLDDSVDVVTSFETIEHFYELDLFLSEIRRILRLSGVLIVSTPAQDIYSGPGTAANGHHVHEMSRREFQATLLKFFPHVTLYLQRTLSGSVLVQEEAPAPEQKCDFFTYEKRDENHLERSRGLPRAKYLVAYASDQHLTEELEASSVYIDTGSIETSSEYFALRQELAIAHSKLLELGDRDQRRQEEMTSIAHDLGAAHQQCAVLTSRMTELQVLEQQHRDKLAAQQAEFTAILQQNERELTEWRSLDQQRRAQHKNIT